MGIFRRKRHQEGVTADASAQQAEPSDAQPVHGNEPEDLDDSTPDREQDTPGPADTSDPGQDAPDPGDTPDPGQDTADPGDTPDPGQDDTSDRGKGTLEVVEDLDEDLFDSSFPRDAGPFDADEQPTDADRLDLGSLRLPAVEGLQVQLELDEATASVTAVRLLLGGSYAQLQAFAAPRSGALWRAIRTELAETVRQQAGSVDVVDGPLGRELLVRRPGNAPLRFLGVDGPRWFLRVVLSGPAATDETAAAPLLEVVKGTVVVRGSEAMAPRELLPLRMPAVEQVPEAEEASAAGRTPLDPIQRGPEITEVR